MKLPVNFSRAFFFTLPDHGVFSGFYPVRCS
jgi:hypothetical protein